MKPTPAPISLPPACCVSDASAAGSAQQLEENRPELSQPVRVQLERLGFVRSGDSRDFLTVANRIARERVAQGIRQSEHADALSHRHGNCARSLRVVMK